MKRQVDRIIETDLLSIGGSGAGITSAIYASRQGVRVTLVSKGKIGYSGNAIMAGGGFSIDGESAKEVLGIEEADVTFTRQKMFECLTKESFFIADQNLVEQYVDEAPTVVKEYVQWAENGKLLMKFVPKPATWRSSGIVFTKVLAQGLKEAEGIDTLEDTTIVEILTKDGVAVGAIGIDLYTGEVILIKAKAVVIGTGGFQPFTMKNTVTDMTGDGAAMVYRAGGQLTDMEFLLSFPTAVFPQEMKGSIYPFIFENTMPKLTFTVRDKHGDALPIPQEIIDLTRGTKLSKLVSCYYMGAAVDAGLGGPNGGVFYDYSAVPDDVKEEQFKVFADRYDSWHKKDHYKGESILQVKEMIRNNQQVEIGLGAEYSMGGAVINEKMETGIPGLYVAGEAGSGVFGACRAGDGLTEMLCQGMRAGLSAAEYIAGAKGGEIPEEQVEAVLGKLFGCFENEGGMNAVELYNEIERACDEGFGVIRSEEGLQKALQRILELKEAYRNITLKNKTRVYNIEWMRAIAAENLLICVEAGIRAAIERKESRGCHIRKDYPQVDHENYVIKYLFKKDGDEMSMDTRKPIVTKLHPIQGKSDNVISYFLQKDLNYKR